MKITKDLEGKRVKITDIDNEIFEGIVSDYLLFLCMEVKAVSEEKVNYFEEEMKALLAGYISDQDTH